MGIIFLPTQLLIFGVLLDFPSVLLAEVNENRVSSKFSAYFLFLMATLFFRANRYMSGSM